VFEAVKQRCNHPTAEQIYVDVRSKDKRISRGTVYRNLNVLVSEGHIQQVKTAAVDHYEAKPEKHQHVICSSCGQIEDVLLPYDEALDSNVSQISGYVITRHRSIFEGICPKCRSK